MNGLTEDILNGVMSDIVKNWERKGGSLTYFTALVRKSGLTAADLDPYLTDHGDTCPECVNHVFASIVYDDLLNAKGGQA